MAISCRLENDTRPTTYIKVAPFSVQTIVFGKEAPRLQRAIQQRLHVGHVAWEL